MVVSCCAFGCKNRHGERTGLGFYRFPITDRARRLKWIKALKRQNWIPTVHSRICGDHFISGVYGYMLTVCAREFHCIF